MSYNIHDLLAHPGGQRQIKLAIAPSKPPFEIDGIRYLEEIQVEGRAFYQFGCAYFNVHIITIVEQRCSRCLAPLRVKVDNTDAWEIEIPPGETSVELERRVLSSIVFSLDPHPLCRPDCRGLCPVCGINLNEHPEHRCEKQNDERLTLKDFLE